MSDEYETLRIQQEAQEKEIKDGINEDPLISTIMPIASTLETQYSGNNWLQGIKFLDSKYSFRKVRGDGNCFYRSFLYSYLDTLLNMKLNGNKEDINEATNEINRIKLLINNSNEDLLKYGYSEVLFESFLDLFLELLESLFTMKTRDELYNGFQDDGESEYWVWFMRLLCSGKFIMM